MKWIVTLFLCCPILQNFGAVATGEVVDATAQQTGKVDRSGISGGAAREKVESSCRDTELGDRENVVSDGSDDWKRLYLSREYRSADDGRLPYRFMLPQGLAESDLGQGRGRDPSNVRSDDLTRYPLVVFFHGAGERGADNELQLVHGASEFAKLHRRRDFPCFVLVPQCSQQSRWVESDWGLASGRGEFPSNPSQPMKLTLDLVDELCHSMPIDSNRVFVAGLSMGAMGAWYAAATRPDRFAAMIEVCGGGDPLWAERYAGVAIWAFHGQSDTVVPIARSREMITALSQNGHWPELRYVEYPKVGHNSWTQTFRRDDVFEWLFSQRKR